MKEDKKKIFEVKYDGDIVDEDNGVTIRTLGSTLPHFQRAMDKAVIYDRDKKFKKGEGMTGGTYASSDLTFYLPEKGSFIIPLFGKLKKGTVDFFNWALTEPYEKAVIGDVAVDAKHQIGAYKVRVREGDVKEVTQQDLLKRSEVDNRSYARSALLQDMNLMFSVLRTKGDHAINIKVEAKGAEREFNFNRNVSKNFKSVVDVVRPTEPVIYKGRYQGYKCRSQSLQKFEVFVYSLFSKQMVSVFVHGLSDLKNFSDLENNDVAVFWASPLQKYGAFDPYNGSAEFVSMVKE